METNSAHECSRTLIEIQADGEIYLQCTICQKTYPSIDLWADSDDSDDSDSDVSDWEDDASH